MAATINMMIRELEKTVACLAAASLQFTQSGDLDALLSSLASAMDDIPDGALNAKLCSDNVPTFVTACCAHLTDNCLTALTNSGLMRPNRVVKDGQTLLPDAILALGMAVNTLENRAGDVGKSEKTKIQYLMPFMDAAFQSHVSEHVKNARSAESDIVDTSIAAGLYIQTSNTDYQDAFLEVFDKISAIWPDQFDHKRVEGIASILGLLRQIEVELDDLQPICAARNVELEGIAAVNKIDGAILTWRKILTGRIVYN